MENIQERNSITPGQDIINDILYMTVATGGLNEGYRVITSERENLTINDLTERGFISTRCPAPEPRWRKTSIDEYLNGGHTPLVDAFEKIQSTIHEYLDLGDSRLSDFLGLWILGTYTYRYFSSYPYIHLNGNADSGKTKTLSLISLLSFNGELSASSSAAYLIRMINDNHATVCMDEMEGFENAKDEMGRIFVGILNSGYKLGAFVGRAQQKGNSKEWKPVRYDSYSPKSFASIGGLLHSLATRCVPLEMICTDNIAIRNRELNYTDKKWQDIRDVIYSAIFSEFQKICRVYNEITDDTIAGREWELWKPIFSVARAIDESGFLYQEQRELAMELVQTKKDKAIEEGEAPRLLIALEELVRRISRDTGFYSVKEISNFLQTIDSENFGWLRDEKRPGRWIARQMRHTGIVTGQSRQRSINGLKDKGFILHGEKIHERLKILGIPHECAWSANTEKYAPSNNGNQETPETEAERVRRIFGDGERDSNHLLEQ